MRLLESQHFFHLDLPIIGYPFSNIIAIHSRGLRPLCSAGAYQETQ